jgi:hypothetical protein
MRQPGKDSGYAQLNLSGNEIGDARRNALVRDVHEPGVRRRLQ